MTRLCSICHFEEEGTPKFCVYCGSPFVAKDPVQDVAPPPPVVRAASSAGAPAESGKKSTRGQWVLYSIGLAIVAFVLYSKLTEEPKVPAQAVVSGPAPVTAAPPPERSSASGPVPETAAPVGAVVAPYAGSFSMAQGDYRGELTVSTAADGIQFSIKSDDASSQQGCMVDGKGKVEGLVFKHGPDAEQCSVTIAFFERTAVVSTNNCGGHCGMKAGASMDGNYVVRKSP